MLQKRFRFPRRSVFGSWLGSYAMILLIPIVVSVIIYSQTGRVLENEINRANEALLKQVQQVLDKKIDEIEQMSLQIALDPKVTGMVKLTESELDVNHRYQMMQLLNDFKLYSMANHSIDDFYVYFKNSSSVISNANRMSDLQVFYEGMHDPGKMSFAEWKELLHTKHTGQFFPMGRMDMNGSSVPTIAYVRTIPLERGTNADAAVLIMLDERRLLESIEQVQWMNQGIVLVMDEQNRILASTEPAEGSEPLSLTYDLLPGSQGIVRSELGKESVSISYITSAESKWKYISIMPSSVFMEKAQYIRNLTFIGLLLCIIAGGAAAYFLARRNYNPVNELIQVLSSKAKLSVEHTINEYDFIRDAISSTLDEKEEMNRRLENQQTALRSNFLMRLLKGRLEAGFPVDDALSSYNLVFHSDRFMVMLFYIEDFSMLFRDSAEKDAEKKMNFVQLIMRNIIEEMAGEEHGGYITEVDGMLACLVNVRGAEDTPEDMQRIASAAQQFIQNRFFIYFTASLSTIHYGVRGIAAAYQEAVEAMEYKMVTGAGQIIHYDQIRDPGQAEKLYYPIEKEQQLINFIKIGDFAKADLLLEEIFVNNFSRRSLSLDMVKCLMFELISTMIKALDAIQTGVQGTMVLSLDPIPRLMQCENYMEMRGEMTSILRQVCEHVDKNKSSHNTDLKEAVCQYIEQNYDDVNLSISSIAEHFAVNTAYLSRFFKEQTGKGMLDTINRTRLDEAKRMLAQDNMTISEIAVKIGYYNSNAFIRTFKKYEGITPGQFRNMTKSEE